MSLRFRDLSGPVLAVTLAALALYGCSREGTPGTQAQAPAEAPADAGVINIYSARHYQSDEDLYQAFTDATGIRVQRIEGKDDALIERILQEGDASPADILFTVDAGRLWRAEQAGIFQAVSSPILEERIPPQLRHPEGKWFGFSTRARIIYYDKTRIEPGAITRYEDLADPRWQGELCIRSGGNIYNLSLMASLIEAHGLEAAEEWARGVVANFARDPQGGDTDQIRAVAAGECGIALANTYYFARLMKSDDPADQAVVERVGWVFPNQDERGTHVNISGAGIVANAPNAAGALRFLEFLASPEAQTLFARGNNEYPVVEGAALDNPALETLGEFKVDPVDATVYGENQAEAQRALDRAGWK
ncbi:Fe(3+) ABC transporter substrate-binding protein [Thioalkalivibrio sp. XN8]|uniref:Fe(3+) ABC transporter substrate-binding protein n=1 Tax=Thioalkalivibrio sp. XN8 TaxID=2712863 RepID=UPI0013EC1FB4|nr:Fe(3+) ABC transporter substrate-binding protein [Thioalkalivibrio sp. XN8]NGP53052.1 Fe(3+) ABC transporter substrate-binding protein [Thioalkalivibrio sp. XN8]